jgi:catechol 2,3-dioxygenase-like lactoylglutathione lyase family enzyme
MSEVAPELTLDHVQIAAPPGAEEAARHFYGALLGLRELPKPPLLAVRGGCWFECGQQQIHVGIEHDFRPAKKAHVAFRLASEALLVGLRTRLEQQGIKLRTDNEIPGKTRFFAEDPWENRIEFC